MKKLAKIVMLVTLGVTIFGASVAYAQDVKWFDFYVTSLNYANTPQSAKVYTSAPAVINTRDGGFVEGGYGLDVFLKNANDADRGYKLNVPANSRSLVYWNGYQQAGYYYHAHVYLTGTNITTYKEVKGSWAADSY